MLDIELARADVLSCVQYRIPVRGHPKVISAIPRALLAGPDACIVLPNVEGRLVGQFNLLCVGSLEVQHFLRESLGGDLAILLLDLDADGATAKVFGGSECCP